MTSKNKTRKISSDDNSANATPVTESFSEVVQLIEEARQRAYQAVNTELIRLYWRIGEYISRKLESAQWGDGVVDQLARHIAHAMPGVRGFTRSNLFRMRQFFEAYAGDKKVSPLVTQLPWTHHLIILGQCKSPEERLFYIRLCVEQRWGKRDLERQLRASLFERAVLKPPKVAPAVRQLHPEIHPSNFSLQTSLPPYPEYKDSGLPWLGQVPMHWELDWARSACPCRCARWRISGPTCYNYNKRVKACWSKLFFKQRQFP
jgi:predicted nuclease of restriction endonuclease-like (RecB) superfamily